MSFALVRPSVNHSLATMLILGVVNLAVPASALANAPGVNDETSRPEVTRKAVVRAPDVLQRSIADAAHRAAQQAPQAGKAAASQSRKGCWAGAALLGGAGAAFVTAWAKHRSWADSGATTTPGSKPPSSVGWSIAAGGVLTGAGLFTLAKGCAL